MPLLKNNNFNFGFFSIVCHASTQLRTPAPSSERQHPEAWPASTYGHLRGSRSITSSFLITWTNSFMLSTQNIDTSNSEHLFWKYLILLTKVLISVNINFSFVTFNFKFLKLILISGIIIIIVCHIFLLFCLWICGSESWITTCWVVNKISAGLLCWEI